ncbi:hypothetical protein C805_00362 [Eubacterium sp. 14-2]|uniref:helix-turn-helix domain-containing protein n=1 Tax=Eubacterium sp. 14-2 TaxID=1235790 RepID=UPI0003377393|nr:helix-turn-helix transcriptional regulator [Eubacterium sp. 14-2]EOT28841.1 hypothetical protein C805_00362 [Eubacterium sp. 14-2]
MTTGERIKSVRDKLQISQVDFADKINVSKQTLYKYENNIITNIPFAKIEAIALIGNVSPAYIMGWEETISGKEKKLKIIHYYESLNDIGKYEAEKRVEELTHIEKYTAADRLLLNAAHERTDTEVTEEMLQHDEDIMDDEIF